MDLKKKMTDKQRIEFAKHVETFFEATYASWKRLFLLSFIKGVATGLGLVVGGTIVVALLLWILGAFQEIPLIGDVAENTRQTIDEKAE